jgi:hypothetical protein
VGFLLLVRYNKMSPVRGWSIRLQTTSKDAKCEEGSDCGDRTFTQRTLLSKPEN